jgi:outer membrane protein assembly factor BamB
VIDFVPMAEPRVRGGVPAGCASLLGNRLVRIQRVGASWSAALASRLEGAPVRMTPLWEIELPADPQHRAPSGKFLSTLSVVPVGAERVFLVSGRGRLLLDVETGAVVARHEAKTGASGRARAGEGALWVPEGRVVTRYDPDTLAVLDRHDVPDEYWAHGATRDGILLLRDAFRAAGTRPLRLWRPEEDAFDVPATAPVAAIPDRLDGLVVVACGHGAARELTAVDWTSRRMRWQEWTASSWTPTGGADSVDPILVEAGDRFFVASEWPAIEARETATGRLVWRCELNPDAEDHAATIMRQPTAIGVTEGVAWAGTHDGELVAADTASGAPLGSATLPVPSGNIPRAILPSPLTHTEDAAVIVVGALGATALARLTRP